MSDLPQKSSEELAAELLELMPSIKMRAFGLGIFLNSYAYRTTRYIYQVAELVLAQQREIEQLKAELEELKQR